MAKRLFSKVSPAIWASRRFRGVSPMARNFHLYLLTNEHIDSAGCYRLPDPYACFDFGIDQDQLETLYSELSQADMISRDVAAEWVLIRRWFKHNPPTNADYAKGTRKLIAAIESDRLREETETAFAEAEVALESRLAEIAASRAERAIKAKLRSGQHDIGNTFSGNLANTNYMRGRG
jgi:hypothetical protein